MVEYNSKAKERRKNMKFKKNIIIYLLLVIVAGTFIFTKLTFKTDVPEAKNVLPAQTQNQEITVIVNFGDDEKTVQVVAGDAYSALIEAGKRLGFEIKTKHYDFGDLVETIGDKTNSTDKAWIYYVNGISGDVAADKKAVKAGDKVEWKYEKPKF